MIITLPPLLDMDELLFERKIFRHAFLLEKNSILEHEKELVSLTMPDIFGEMENLVSMKGFSLKHGN